MGMISPGITIAELPGRARGWTPSDLGSLLLAYWDAERLDKIDLSGSLVNSWTDSVGALSASQSTSGFKPVYSATSFNGRPGITFDGTDDLLLNTALAANLLPTGSNPSEIWVLVNQTVLPAVTTTGTVFLYGTTGANNRRVIRRVVVSAVNRAQASTGTGGGTTQISDTVGDLSGYHVMQMVTDAVNTNIAIDGAAPISGAVVPNSLNSAIAMGCVTGGTNPFGGSINKIIVTAPLDSAQRALLLAFLKPIGGIA